MKCVSLCRHALATGHLTENAYPCGRQETPRFIVVPTVHSCRMAGHGNQVSKDITKGFGYARLFSGRFLKTVSPGKDYGYPFVYLTYGFEDDTDDLRKGRS